MAPALSDDMNQGVKILGTGACLPEKVLTNHDLTRLVDTTDKWIRERTGIVERRVAAADEPTSLLAARAATAALAAAHLEATDVDLLIVATMTPDALFPNTGCFVQQRLGATRAACFSVEAACSGFLFALDAAAAMLRVGTFRRALVIGAEEMSKLVNWQDRSTCVLFGDAAGAVVLGTCPAAENSYLGAVLGSDGSYTDLLHVPGGGTRQPFSQAVLDQRLHYLQMSGAPLFKLAVTKMVEAATQVLAANQVTVAQLRWLVPHQANMRIINSVAKYLGLADAQVFVNVQKYGNTSAASVPVALDELARAGQLAKGDYLVLAAFGGGLTWGATLLRW